MDMELDLETAITEEMLARLYAEVDAEIVKPNRAARRKQAQAQAELERWNAAK